MDSYGLPLEYKINSVPTHYIDLHETDAYQKEVYVFGQSIMKRYGLHTVVDVGCGSGYKLVKYLGNHNTIGIETEPCISFLRKTYPSRFWLNSGEPEKSFCSYDINVDLVICSDVIEHILDPNNLIAFLQSLNAKYYIISTPCRQRLVDHFGRTPLDPPQNKAHVREWTMNEFKSYISKFFTILESCYGIDQIECQYHLVKLL